MTEAPTIIQTTNEPNQANDLRTIAAVYGPYPTIPRHPKRVSLPVGTVSCVPRLVVTGPGVPAQEAVWRLVTRAQRHDQLAPVSVVVPSAVAGLQLRRAFSQSARTGLVNVRMLLAHELAFTIAQPRLAAAERTPLPDLLDRELVRMAIDGAEADVALLRGLERHPATIDAIVTTLRDLAGLDDVALARLRACGGRAAMIATIESSRRRLAVGTYDREQLLREAAAALDEPDGVAARDGVGHVVLYAPRRPTPGTIALWRALARHGHLDAVALVTGDIAVDTFESATVLLLAELCEPSPHNNGNDGADGDGANGMASAPPSKASVPVATIVHAPSAHDEVRWVAADLTRRAASGLRLGDVAIAVRGADAYPRIVAQVFDGAAIPWAGRSPRTLAHGSAGRVLLGALAMAASAPDLRRDDVFHWLASGPILDPQTGAPAPASRWDLVSRRAGVVAGATQWDERLAHYASEMRAEATQARAAGNDRHVATAGRAVGDAEALAHFITTLQVDLASLGQPTWRAWADWAITVLRRYLGDRDSRDATPSDTRADTPGGTPAGASGEGAERARDAVAHRQVLDVLDGLALLDRAGTAPRLEQFARTVATALDAATDRVGRFGEGVFVGAPGDLRGCSFAVVYVLGMAEGRYPPRGLEDPLLTDSERAAADDSVPLQRQRAARERAEHVHALGAAAEVVLSFPRADVREQRTYRPAPLLLETAEALAGYPVGAEALLDITAPWCVHVASYSASLHARAPAPLHEAVVRCVDARRVRRLDVAAHPLLRGLPSTALGMRMIGARASDVHTPFDGVIGELDGLRPTGLLSATALQDWAKCGFSYFAQRVLRIEVVERPERIEEIASTDRGTLLHEIFERFVRDAPTPTSPSEPWSRDARLMLVAIARECCDEAERRGLTGHPLLWRRSRREIEQVVACFCAADDALRCEYGVMPWRTELSFGFDAAADAADGADEVRAEPPLTMAMRDGTEVRFRGRIDRIDRAPDGARLVVTDYKSGRAYTSGMQFDPVSAGRQLQLAIYAMVAQRLEPQADVIGYYRYVSAPDVAPASYDYASFAVTVARLHEVVHDMVGGIRSGAFPAVPGSTRWNPRTRQDTFENCRFCAYDRLCPTDRGEAHDRKLADPQLAPLLALECDQETLDALVERIDGPLRPADEVDA